MLKHHQAAVEEINQDELKHHGNETIAISNDLLKQLTAMADHNMYDCFTYRISLEMNCFVIDQIMPRAHCHNYKPTTTEEWAKLSVDELPPADCILILYNFRFMGEAFDGRETIRHQTLLVLWAPDETPEHHIELYMKGKETLRKKIQHIFHDLLDIVAKNPDDLSLATVTKACSEKK